MDVRQLTYFAHRAQFKSISAAAAELNVAQPVISRQVAQLGIDPGTTLFVRHGRGIALTETGKRVLVHAQAILEEAARLRQDVVALSRSPAGLSAASRVVAHSGWQQFFDLMQGKRWRTTK